MLSRSSVRICFLLVVLALPSGSTSLRAQELPTPTPNLMDATFQAPPAPVPLTAAELADRVMTQQALRSYLQLQEQLHATLLAIQKNRDDAQMAATQTRETMDQRLKTIETALGAQRTSEAQTAENSNRLVLLVAGMAGALGFVGIIAICWLQLRAMHRMVEVTTALPAAQAYPPALLPEMSGHNERLLSNEAEQSNLRLRSTIQTLETRLQELEQTALGAGSGTAGQARIENRQPEPRLDATVAEQAGRVSLLLGKGQSLLHLNEAADALKCFDQVLVLDPRNTEALVKKGTALERLRKLEAAIECYDQAIAINDAMTLAYLYKGGVYNQLERFNEALECYERALRTQQKEQISTAG